MKTAKVEKLVPNLLDKNEYVTYVKKLKHTLNHGLFLKKITYNYYS